MPSNSHLSPLRKRRSAPDLRGGTDSQHAACPFHSDFPDKERPASPVSSPSALRRPSSALGLRRVFVDIDGRAKLIESPDPLRMGDARYALRLANPEVTKQLNVRTSVHSTRGVSQWLETLSLVSEYDTASPGGPDSPDVRGAALDGLPHEVGATHTQGNFSFVERLSSGSLGGPACATNAPHQPYSAAFFPPKTSAPVPALLPAFEWSRSVPPVPAEWDSDSDREKDACAANDAAGDCDEPFTVSEHESDTESTFELRALNAEIDYLKQLVSDEIMERAGVASENAFILNEVVASSDDEGGRAIMKTASPRHESHLPAESDDAQPEPVDDALASSDDGGSGMCRGV